MKNFDEHAYRSLLPFQKYCGAEEFKQLKEEAAQFLKNNNHLPVAEQYKKFMQEYGPLFSLIRDSEHFHQVKSLNGKMTFFVVLVVVSIIIALKGALG